MGRQEWQLLFWVILRVKNKLQDVLEVIRHRCVDAGRKEKAAESRVPVCRRRPVCPYGRSARHCECEREVVTDATHEANLLCEKTLLNTAKRRGRAESQAHPQKDRQDR